MSDKTPERPIALFPASEILPLTTRGVGRQKFTVKGKTYEVNMHSSRFVCFRKNPQCVVCGIEGTVMGLVFGGNSRPHFNLYATDPEGKLVLMTKDHIIPSSKGGMNRPRNYQTMCADCNCRKSNISFTIDELRTLKELSSTIDTARQRIKRIRAEAETREAGAP